MNKLELLIYNIVKNNPKLKQHIVDIYQDLFALVPQKSIKTTLPISERKGFYFGFHDKCPFSPEGDRLLSHRVLINYRKVKTGDKIEIGFWEGNKWSEYIPLGLTTGWNWQLGSMLQWYGNSNEQIIYNDIEKGQHISIVKSINGNTQYQYDWPIVHISPNQKFACTYNFTRAEKAMPGYGIIIDNKSLGDNNNNFFKIFSCHTGKPTFQISLDEAISISHQSSMQDAFHFFHHALFNPNSQRVFFLHRWVDKNYRRWTRMFSVGVDGSNLYLFPMNEMVSHITWASPSEIFAYLRYPNIGDGYFLVEDMTGKSTQYFEKVLNSDGHPTMNKNRGIVITDTYPDRFRNQILVLGLIENGHRIDLCQTHLPRLFKRELQVDLHPRIHPYQPIACIDSAHNGSHSLITIDFSKYL